MLMNGALLKQTCVVADAVASCGSALHHSCMDAWLVVVFRETTSLIKPVFLCSVEGAHRPPRSSSRSPDKGVALLLQATNRISRNISPQRVLLARVDKGAILHSMAVPPSQSQGINNLTTLIKRYVRSISRPLARSRQQCQHQQLLS